MGRQAEVLAKLDGHTLPGVAHLESDILHLRADRRISVRFSDIARCQEDDGWLRLEFRGHRLELHLGVAAATWQQAILTPPTLLDKLGVRPGVAVWATGFDDLAFLGDTPLSTDEAVDVVLFHAPAPSALNEIRRARGAVKQGGCLWVVYPRGDAALPERLVVSHAGIDGWVDVKTCRFDESRTALKFVRRAR